jgi:hypothetical protein
MKIRYEHTDTFGGEANYCWVKRGDMTLPEGTSRLAVVRRVKDALGLSGVRCKTEDFGDSLRLKPVGVCQVVFIDYVS